MTKSEILKGKTFYVSSDVTSKPTTVKLIKDNGGTIAFMLNKNVDYYISTSTEFRSQSTNLKKAASYNIPVVSEAFVSDCDQRQCLISTMGYTFTLEANKPISFFDPPKSPSKSNTPIKLTTTTSSSLFGTSPSSSSSSSSSPSSSSLSPNTFSVGSKGLSPPAARKASKTTVKVTAPSIPAQPAYEKSTLFAAPTFTSSAPIPSLFAPKPSTTPSFFSSIPTPVITTTTSTTTTTSPSNDVKLIQNPRKIVAKLYGEKDVQPDFDATGATVLLKHTLQHTTISGQSSNNKFYRLELQHDKIGGKYRVLTKYGRTDGKATIESRYPNNLDEALNIYSSIYNEKTGPIKNYKEVALLEDQEQQSTDKSFVDNSKSLPDLDKSVEPLIEFIYKEALTHLTTQSNSFISSRGIETPLGVLALSQVEKGEQVLDKIYEILKTTSPNQTKLEQLSSEFYTIIPHRMGRGKNVTADNVIKNLDQLNAKVELLQLMKDLIRVNESGAVSLSATKMQYYALKSNITPLSPSSSDYQAVSRMVNTAAAPHATHGKVQVKNIFKINKDSENQTFAGHILPSKLLFHGTRPCNLVGILSRGMLLPKVVVATGASNRTDFGYLGSGIYFGDHVSTAVKYAHPANTDGKTRFAFVSTVALGLISKHTKINSSLSKPPVGYQSCLGEMKNSYNSSDFQENEYVIYDTKQQKQTYLIEFNVEGSNNSITSTTTTTTAAAPPTSTTSSTVWDTSFTSSFSNLSIKPASSSITSGFSNLSISTPTPTPTPTPVTSYQTPVSSYSSSSSSTSSFSSNNNNNNKNILKVDSNDDQVETKYRQMFANSSNDSVLKDLYLHTQKIFSNTYQHKATSVSVDDLFNDVATKNPMIRTSQYEFDNQWKTFTSSLFDGFNWKNVFVAGGSVLGCTLADRSGKFEDSDIDLFLYALDEYAAKSKLEEIQSFLKSKVPGLKVARTKYAITFILGKQRNVQVVLRIYKSPAEVLMGFDIDCCAIGYNGSDVYALPRAIDSIKNSLNVVSMSRRSLSYEYRLYKYSKRGFAIRVPGFTRNRVKEASINGGYFYNQKIKDTQGLSKLLIFEYYSVATPHCVEREAISDYSDFNIPHGTHWSATSAASVVNYKEKARFFSRKKRDGIKHSHNVIVGDNINVRTAQWCQLCRNGEKMVSDNKSVGEEIAWITKDPGQQILTGSFHPVSDENWDNLNKNKSSTNTPTTIHSVAEMIYKNQTIPKHEPFSPKSTLTERLNHGHLLCFAVVNGSNNSLQSLLSQGYVQHVNIPDHLGYYPIHYACASNNVDGYNLLVNHGALVFLPSKNYQRVSCYMLAKHYGYSQITSLIEKSPYYRKIRNMKSRIPNLIYTGNWSTNTHATKPNQINTNIPIDNVFGAIKLGNLTKVVEYLMQANCPERDSIGNTLLHHAIFSPLPFDMFTNIISYKPSLLSNKNNQSNMFNQSLHSFIKYALSNIKPMFTEPHHNFTPLYVVNELKQLLSRTDIVSDGYYTVPCFNSDRAFLSVTNSVVQSATVSVSPVVVVVAETPKPPVGFGGKFPARPPSPDKKPTFGTPTPTTFGAFGSTPVTGFGSKPAATGFGSKPAATGFGSKPAATSFGSVPAATGFGSSVSSTGGFGSTPTPKPTMGSFVGNPYSQPAPPVPVVQPFGNQAYSVPSVAKNNINELSLQSPNVTGEFIIRNGNFINASAVAKILIVIEDLIATGKIAESFGEKVKKGALTYHLPLFNVFEAYYFNKDMTALLKNLSLLNL